MAHYLLLDIGRASLTTMMPLSNFTKPTPINDIDVATLPATHQPVTARLSATSPSSSRATSECCCHRHHPHATTELRAPMNPP